MKKTKVRKYDGRPSLTVNAETLAGILDCGRNTAVKIGSEAGAEIKIGRRVLYKVSMIDKYLDSISGSRKGTGNGTD